MNTRMMACALVLASVVSGCGISPTRVMDGGEPAVGFQPSTRLYFVSGARLRAVSRPLPWPPLRETLDLLLAGPSSEERRRGVRTELAPGTDTPSKVTSDAAMVRIFLAAPIPVPVPSLAPREAAQVRPRDQNLWLGQLTCTAASAVATRSNLDPDAVTVTIQRGGAELGSFRCSEFPRAPE
ncbi:hypothetical protein [Streptosporangium sp. NPDC001681]|uniref:hypothetical protein n=1 Tax=Streptosporangium sp. NPDC001681 TaxID=3154395 RepID=UPI00332A3FBF